MQSTFPRLFPSNCLSSSSSSSSTYSLQGHKDLLLLQHQSVSPDTTLLSPATVHQQLSGDLVDVSWSAAVSPGASSFLAVLYTSHFEIYKWCTTSKQLSLITQEHAWFQPRCIALSTSFTHTRTPSKSSTSSTLSSSLTIAIGSGNGVQVYNYTSPHTSKKNQTLKFRNAVTLYPFRPVSCVAFAVDGSYLAVATLDAYCAVWAREHHELAAALSTGRTVQARVSGDGHVVPVPLVPNQPPFSEDGLPVCSANVHLPLALEGVPCKGPTSITCSPDSRLLVVTMWNGPVFQVVLDSVVQRAFYLVSLYVGNERFKDNPMGARHTSAAFSPNGEVLAVASDNLVYTFYPYAALYRGGEWPVAPPLELPLVVRGLCTLGDGLLVCSCASAEDRTLVCQELPWPRVAVDTVDQVLSMPLSSQVALDPGFIGSFYKCSFALSSPEVVFLWSRGGDRQPVSLHAPFVSLETLLPTWSGQCALAVGYADRVDPPLTRVELANDDVLVLSHRQLVYFYADTTWHMTMMEAPLAAVQPLLVEGKPHVVLLDVEGGLALLDFAEDDPHVRARASLDASFARDDSVLVTPQSPGYMDQEPPAALLDQVPSSPPDALAYAAILQHAPETSITLLAVVSTSDCLSWRTESHTLSTPSTQDSVIVSIAYPLVLLQSSTGSPLSWICPASPSLSTTPP